MAYSYDSFDFEFNGKPYRAKLYHDECTGAPWKEHDGHGPVSDWRHKDSKRAGEWELNESHGSYRFYDAKEAQAIALRDGWGLGADELAALTHKAGRIPTKGMIAAEAVRMDYKRLRGWCVDDWHWCGVEVQALDSEGDPVGETQSLWGIESDAGDYFQEVAKELAAEIEG